ncbi:MAG: hypothetical protein PHZ02_05470 [Desulfocapsaceae bacterium]|nr:hypothetical protein [Desulfocapsaceae bacterium]
MELKDNQAALIMESSKDGEIKVNVAFGNVDDLLVKYAKPLH